MTAKLAKQIYSYQLRSLKSTKESRETKYGLAPERLVCYIREKIRKADEKNKKGFLIYSNYLEEELKCRGTPFDIIGYTEKPDIAASKLSEGRVVILLDGDPFVITAPFFFVEHFQSSDDYCSFDGERVHARKIVTVKVAVEGVGESIDLEHDETRRQIERNEAEKLQQDCLSLFETYRDRGVDILNVARDFERKYPRVSLEDMLEKTDLTVEFRIRVQGSQNVTNFQ